MYRVRIRPRAEREMRRLPPEVFGRVDAKIQGLREDPRPPGVEKLRSKEGWRIRVGDYRVIYEVDDRSREVMIYRVQHRKDIYRPR